MLYTCNSHAYHSFFFSLKDRLVSGSFGQALPQIVYGSLSIIAGLLALHLPETLKRNLPETIEDGEMFGR